MRGALALLAGLALAAAAAPAGVQVVTQDLATAGVLDAEAVAAAKAAGYEVVIDLRTRAEGLDAERALVTAAGLDYQNLPVDRAAPQPTDLAAFSALLGVLGDRKLLVICATGKRAASMVMLDRVTRSGVPLEIARAAQDAVWTPNEVWQKYIDATLATRRVTEDGK